MLVAYKRVMLKGRMGCASAQLPNRDGPTAWLLGDGTRLHLQHGPIDLIIDAQGEPTEIKRSFEQASIAFENILEILASQLTALRSNYQESSESVYVGDVAQRMAFAVKPFYEFRVTPMAAVAGSVADHVLACMTKGRDLERTQVNNGGDIAFYLSANKQLKIGICTSAEDAAYTDTLTITSKDRVSGVATSGWQGRSFSLGIADAVTVMADTAASADVVATLVANAVDLPAHTGITKVPAIELQPDSDLGDRLVTVNVAPLSERCKKQALDAGEACVHHLMQYANVHSCYLHLQGQTRIVESKRFNSELPLRQRYAYC